MKRNRSHTQTPVFRVIVMYVLGYMPRKVVKVFAAAGQQASNIYI